MEQQRDGHLEDLLLPARERPREGAPLVAEHRKPGHQRLDVGAHARVRARVGAHLQILRHAHGREVTPSLRHVGAAAPQHLHVALWMMPTTPSSFASSKLSTSSQCERSTTALSSMIAPFTAELIW